MSGGKRSAPESSKKRNASPKKVLAAQAQRAPSQSAPARNDLEAYWVPFTPNRQFKAAPRLIAKAKACITR